MKLVLLCSSLEYGCDGVGDYSRRLAGELIRQGHQVAIIALHDSHIVNEFIGTQETENTIITVFRLPSILTLPQRIKQAKIWIDSFDPDWLSLQFVLFGFQVRGLPFGLSRWLAKLGEGRRWHIMFHELWVGMAVNSSLKLIIWGWLQQKLIEDLLRKLSPIIVHTQSQLYQMQLAKLGIKATLLPLFSNIPVIDSTDAGVKQLNNQIKLVLFGTIHPNSPVEKFSEEAALFARQHQIQLSLAIIGRSGLEQERWATAWQSLGLPVSLLGEQPLAKISAILQDSSVGMATTAFALIEKSGSVAAMREHSLPIICVADAWRARGLKNINHIRGIIEYCHGNLELCLSVKPELSYTHTISYVTSLFLKALGI